MMFELNSFLTVFTFDLLFYLHCLIRMCECELHLLALYSFPVLEHMPVKSLNCGSIS